MSSPPIALLLLLVLSTTTNGSVTATVDKPVVSVVSALPNGTPAMQIRCKSEGSEVVVDQVVSAGQGCSWTAKEGALYRCNAVWTRLFASWHAFQPRRDAGHSRVSWLVRDQGFFLDVNGTGWVRKADWETE